VNLAERVHGLSVQLLLQFLCYDVFIFVECVKHYNLTNNIFSV